MTLRVGVFQDPVVSTPCALEPMCDKRGFGFDITALICEKLKLSCTFIPIYNTEYGDGLDNGTGTGMVGEVQRGELDTFMPSFSPTYSRMKLISFSEPVYYGDAVLMTRSPTRPGINWRMIWIFQWPIWLAFLLLWSASAHLISWSYTKLSQLMAPNANEKSFFHLCLRLIVNNFERSLMRFHSNRVMIVVWLLATIVISSAYTGFMFTTNITVKSSLPFMDEESFVRCLERNECSLIAPSTTISHLQYFTAPGTNKTARIRRALTYNKIIVTPLSQIANAILKDRNRYLVFPTNNMGYRVMTSDNRDCNYYKINLHSSLQDASTFPMAKNSTHLKRFNKIARQIREYGFHLHFERKYTGPIRCVRLGHGIDRNDMLLSMFTTFCLLAFGICLGVVALIAEIRHGCRQRCRVRQLFFDTSV